MRCVLDKKGNVKQLPGFFQIMMLVVVFAGLTFIVADKFKDTTIAESTVTTTLAVANESGYINATGYTLAEYGTGITISGVVIINSTDNTTIGAGNYTLASGVITNATATNWDAAGVSYSYSSDGIGTGLNPYNVINDTETAIYDYGIGFLGIIILVTMVYLIISIVSGSGKRKN